MNLGTGLTNRPGTDPAAGAEPAAAPKTGWRARLAADKRVLGLLAVTVPLAAAGAAYLLLFSGDPAVDDAGPVAAASVPAPAPTPSEAGPAASGSGTGTAKAAGSAGSSRNPFAPRPSASSPAASGSASGSATEVASTVTATVTDPAVYLTLFSIGTDGKAAFSVNGTGYTQNPGDTFGEGKALTYHKTVKVSGTTCAAISYNDQTDTVCPGEMHQVG